MRSSRGFFGAFRPVAVGSLTEVSGAGKRPRTAALECPIQGLAAARPAANRLVLRVLLAGPRGASPRKHKKGFDISRVRGV